VWNASTGAELKRLDGHSHAVCSVAFSSDGTRIVSGSNDKSVRVWDASTGAELKRLDSHTNPVSSVAISSDGTRIVSGSRDKSVRVWDASTGAEQKTPGGHSDWVNSDFRPIAPALSLVQVTSLCGYGMPRQPQS